MGKHKKVYVLTLTQGKVALVDKEDFEYLSQWKWYYHSNGYAVRSDYSNGKPARQVRMHRQLMGEPKLEVDHKNLDKLDNRRRNLRLATKSQNQQNVSLPRHNKSGYKGVSSSPSIKGTWLVYIRHKYIGSFRDIKQAAKAYNAEALKIYGEFARLNNV